jgi:hypothetical protein
MKGGHRVKIKALRAYKSGYVLQLLVNFVKILVNINAPLLDSQ